MTEVAIIGAGPYGLSIAAYLQHFGCSYQVFGRPMLTWRNMPEGISLKTPASSTNICAPRPNFLYPEWCRANGHEDFEPCSMASFAAYGLWAQEQLVANVNPVDVTSVKRVGDEFMLELANGATHSARKVVIATGLSHFETMPKVLSALGPRHVTHTAHRHHYRDFRDQHVAVIGAGASAIEASAMIHEAGGHPVQLVRESKVVIYDRSKRQRSLASRLKTPATALGPGWKSMIYSKVPGLAHALPEARRIRLDRLYFGPSGPWWIKERFVGIVPVHTNCSVANAHEDGGKIVIATESANGAKAEFRVDHVIAGTGYEVDVDKLTFVDKALAAEVSRVLRAPKLSRHFESSVPGLYFAGPCAALSFGPLLRFVAGADFAAKTIARRLTAQTRKNPSNVASATKRRVDAA